ncbi:MAG: UDP-2,3-diacylglucosamine diphosphatase [Pirellulales bacterium]|nr:UDP-2,3-diacylglucosamine diphosphatase [Pirellulales bacterium]
MIRCQGRLDKQYRSIFVSDIHLGCKHAQAEAFLGFLQSHDADHLYLVGDIIDGWKLRKTWRWSDVYHAIFRRLLDMAERGTQVYFTPGNHDAFFRDYLHHFGFVNIADQFIHTAADESRYLVTHGDRFDKVEQEMQWLSKIATHGYDLLLSTNYWLNRLRGKGQNYYAFCGAVKRKIKFLVQHVSQFETLLAKHADEQACDGVICGHIHSPKIEKLETIAYCNTGDWVENCSALVEHDDGSLEILLSDGRRGEFLPSRYRSDRMPAPSRNVATAGIAVEPMLACSPVSS